MTEGWPGVEGLRVHVDTPPPISTSSTPLSCGYVSSVDTEPRSLGSLRLSTMLRTEILNPRKPRRTWCFMRWPQAQQVEQTRALWEERERAVLPYNRPSIEPPLRRTLKTASMECQASSFIELDSSILHDDFLLMTIQTSGQVLPLALPIFRLLSTFPDPNSDTIFPMNCPAIASVAFFHRAHFRLTGPTKVSSSLPDLPSPLSPCCTAW